MANGVQMLKAVINLIILFKYSFVSLFVVFEWLSLLAYENGRYYAGLAYFVDMYPYQHP